MRLGRGSRAGFGTLCILGPLRAGALGGGSLLEWSPELYMHQTPLPKGLRTVVLLFWMPVLMASTFGKGHIRPPSFGLFPCVVLCLYMLLDSLLLYSLCVAIARSP